jgi:hypothetical protein
VIASDRYPIGTPLAEVAAGKAEQHDPRADELALLELAAWCEQFSPTVGIEPPDNLCLEVTGLDQLFGSEQLLAQQVLQAFSRRGLIVKLAIADTLGAAWALARFGNAPCIAPVGDKVAGKGQYYHELHLTYWGLRKLVERFQLHDYTRRILSDPEAFGAAYMLKRGSPKARLAAAIARHAYWLLPSYIWLLRKPQASA